ncbi:MAG: DUF3604 domain-containing protein, partial [Thermoanaerobaculia bacterium]
MNRRIIEGIIVKIETKPCLLSATVVAAIALLIGPTLAFAQSIGEPGRDSGKPNPLKNVYFGEQHLHTQSSADAFAFGTRSTPEDAYRFGQG